MSDFPLVKKLGLTIKITNSLYNYGPFVEASELEKVLQSAPVAYGKNNKSEVERHISYWDWHRAPYTDFNSTEPDTHTGRLILIEEIEKKKCSHIDIEWIYKDHPNGLAREAKCRNCNAKLKAKWEAV